MLWSSSSGAGGAGLLLSSQPVPCHSVASFPLLYCLPPHCPALVVLHCCCCHLALSCCPCYLVSFMSLPPVSLFHPPSTPRAVACKAGGGWCILCHCGVVMVLVISYSSCASAPTIHPARGRCWVVLALWWGAGVHPHPQAFRGWLWGKHDVLGIQG